jgi:hypothetical protein
MKKHEWEHRCDTVVDDSCLELVVSYNIREEESQIEECHGFHEVGGGHEVELLSVEVVIAGKGIDILKQLNPKQEQRIIDNLEIW